MLDPPFEESTGRLVHVRGSCWYEGAIARKMIHKDAEILVTAFGLDEGA